MAGRTWGTLTDVHSVATTLDIDKVANQRGQGSQRLPVLAARVTKTTDRGRIMLGGSMHELRWDGQSEISDASALGWGVLPSGRVGIGERNFILWDASAGRGWARPIVPRIGSGAAAPGLTVWLEALARPVVTPR